MDYRLGLRQYDLVPQPGEIVVRLHSEYKKCVLVIGLNVMEGNGTSHFQEMGTAFLLRHIEGKFGFDYLVTAGHVARQVEGSPLAIRVNAKDGGAQIVEAQDVKWTYHPSDDCDLAIAPASVSLEADHAPYLFDQVLNAHRRKAKRIEEGTPTYLVGLFRVIPAERILELLEGHELKTQREVAIAQRGGNQVAAEELALEHPSVAEAQFDYKCGLDRGGEAWHKPPRGG